MTEWFGVLLLPTLSALVVLLDVAIQGRDRLGSIALVVNAAALLLTAFAFGAGSPEGQLRSAAGLCTLVVFPATACFFAARTLWRDDSERWALIVAAPFALFAGITAGVWQLFALGFHL